MVLALAPRRAKKATNRRNAVQEAPQPPITKKGRDRRNKLKTAMVKLLETNSYHAIRIGDIAGKAGIPASVFYHYFKSKEDLTVELLEELHAHFEQSVLVGAPYKQLYDGILSVTRAIFSLYGENIGLIRALIELDEQGMSEQWEVMTLNWQQLVAKSLVADTEPGHADPQLSLAMAYALSGMCNSFAHAYFLTRTPALLAAFPNAADAADFVAQLWYRTVRLENPPGVGPDSFLAFVPAKHLRTKKTKQS
jgi:AcrR family transcriptional regulator